MNTEESIMKRLEWLLRNSTYGKFVPDSPCYKAGEALNRDVSESFSVSDEDINEIERSEKDV